MTAKSWDLLLIALVALLTISANPAHADEGCGDWCMEDDNISGRLDGVEFIDVIRRQDPRVYAYTSRCFPKYYTQIADYCHRDGYIPRPDTVDCRDDELMPPRWSRLRADSDDTWRLDRNFTCPGDDGYPFTFDDFANLPIAPSPLAVQPDNGWVIAGLDTVVMSDDLPQGFRTQLLGTNFEIVAEPAEYSWDFGDGSDPLVTTDPGAPWPNHTVSHIYQASGAVEITLTTRWRGAFRIEGASHWSPVNGTGETVTAGPTITVHTARTHLVEDSLD